MLDYEITIGSPWYLALGLLVPLFWLLSYRSLTVIGPIRWVVINALRSVVLALLILALADVQTVRTSDRLTVIYLLDQSWSIPAAHRREMIDYVNAAIGEQRLQADRVGVIVFGQDAAIEIPPIDDDVRMARDVESPLNPEFTNLAGALKLAQASFPEDAAKRIVVVSDGNENIGNVLQQAEGLRHAGIGIDVVPVRYEARSEVVVERLGIPSDVRRDQPFEMKVVISNTAHPPAEPDGDGDGEGGIPGRLALSQVVGGEEEVLKEMRVVLPPGRKKVIPLRHEGIDQANFYTYQVKFIPDRAGDDAMDQNNRATAFTHVRGEGQVLLIVDHQTPGEFALLARRLRMQGLEVTQQRTDQLFATPADLMPYDTVVLANVPRAADENVGFSDEQISMLVRNTQQMGAGLVMLGGENSFGAGGWIGTELEEAMPVDFEIKNAEVVPRGALVLLMHACEIPRGNHWQKKIAEVAIKALGAQDYCGLLYWGMQTDWMWRHQGQGLAPVGPNRNRMLSLVTTMTPGDMPDFDAALGLAVPGFRSVPGASVKHMIIISDGDPTFADPSVLDTLKQMKVTVATVAVGAHGQPDRKTLQDIATATGGHYYEPRNPQALPRIFQREARRVARPLCYENSEGFSLQKTYPHEMVKGIEALPPLTGYVLTSEKTHPLVEVSLRSPEPAGRATGRNRTVLASWNYGLGKAVAFTSDAGRRWTSRWTTQAALAKYDKLFGQIIGWSMRPSGKRGKFTVATEIEDRQVRVVVTALDENDEFLNFLNLSGSALDPELKRIRFNMEQTAPGRYIGSFPTGSSGSYFIVLSHALEKVGPILTGVNLPYSDEFRNRQTDEELLKSLARLVPAGQAGLPGVFIEPQDDPQLAHPWLTANAFRPEGLSPATSSQDVWYFLVLVGSCLFFFDVFFRRVQVSLTWVPPMAGRIRDKLLRRQPAPQRDETIERLRSRKAEVTDRIEQLRSDARFEPPSDGPVDLDTLQQDGPAAAEAKPATPAGPSLADQKADDETYTERLLRAKKKAWDKPDDK